MGRFGLRPVLEVCYDASRGRQHTTTSGWRHPGNFISANATQPSTTYTVYVSRMTNDDEMTKYLDRLSTPHVKLHFYTSPAFPNAALQRRLQPRDANRRRPLQRLHDGTGSRDCKVPATSQLLLRELMHRRRQWRRCADEGRDTRSDARHAKRSE